MTRIQGEIPDNTDDVRTYLPHLGEQFWIVQVDARMSILLVAMLRCLFACLQQPSALVDFDDRG